MGDPRRGVDWETALAAARPMIERWNALSDDERRRRMREALAPLAEPRRSLTERTMRRICDGCNVRIPWEHRCHEDRATVDGRQTGLPCECMECRVCVNCAGNEGGHCCAADEDCPENPKRIPPA